MNRRDLIRMLSGGVAGIPAVKSIERMELKKDDTIVFSYDGHISDSAKLHILDSLAKAFPGHKAIVIDQGAELKVIRQS